jgi:hypothetical protein
VKLFTGVDATRCARQAISMNETSTECVEHVTAERLVKLPKIPQLDLPPLLTRDRLNCSMAGPG